MKILVAEDDPVTHKLIVSNLERWGYDVIGASNGTEAWKIFQTLKEPMVIILDWEMPGLSGIEVCRRIVKNKPEHPFHIIFLTSKTKKEDVAEALKAGTNDFLKKPLEAQEFKSRVHVGAETVILKKRLRASLNQLGKTASQHNREMDEVALEYNQKLNEVMSENAKLKQLIPVCSYCKTIRDDDDYWDNLDVFIDYHSDNHSEGAVCPECREIISKADFAHIREKIQKSKKKTTDQIKIGKQYL